MKYKILKEIRQFPEFRNLQPGEIFENFTSAYIGKVGVPVSILIEQGFVEKVKETSKPKWKVGDYVVNTCTNSFIKIFSVSESNNPRIYNESGNYYYITESDLRDPTPEELSVYFR